MMVLLSSDCHINMSLMVLFIDSIANLFSCILSWQRTSFSRFDSIFLSIPYISENMLDFSSFNTLISDYSSLILAFLLFSIWSMFLNLSSIKLQFFLFLSSSFSKSFNSSTFCRISEFTSLSFITELDSYSWDF